MIALRPGTHDPLNDWGLICRARSASSITARIWRGILKMQRVREPEWKARTVSAETALRCVDRVAELQGVGAISGVDEDLNEHTIALHQLIVFARKRGIRMRPESLNWLRLLIATAAGPVLLRLNNGNVIVALKNPQSGAEHVVVFDPTYESGRSFFLPREALEQVWTGDALILEPKQSKTQRTVRWLIGLLSVCGFVAGAFYLFQVWREVMGH
jgi:ABC-type bacteriocin/lantibiotic exporter with double-glycine peptidase domain